MTTAKCRGGKDHVTEDLYRAELAGRSWGLEGYNSFAGGDDIISLNARSSMIGSIRLINSLHYCTVCHTVWLWMKMP
jgi:hypothetical protein